MHGKLETCVQGPDGVWSRPMVRLSGGGFIKTFGAGSLKKFKLGLE